MKSLIIAILTMAIACFYVIYTFYTPLFNLSPNPYIYFFQFWFPLLTVGSHLFIQHMLKKANASAFVRGVMLSMSVRMFASVFILIIAVFTMEKLEVKPTIYVFAFLYFVYFIIDVLGLTNLLKRLKN